MAAQAAPLAAYGIEYARNAVADIVFYDILHEEPREVYAHHGIYQVEPVGRLLVERACEQQGYLGYDPV